MNHYVNNLISLDAGEVPVGTLTTSQLRHFVVGGRGYGKVAAARRAFLDLPIGKPRTYAPGIGDVVWACKKPTDPVFTPRQGGWWEERTAAYFRGEADMLDIVTDAKNYAREGKWVI